MDNEAENNFWAQVNKEIKSPIPYILRIKDTNIGYSDKITLFNKTYQLDSEKMYLQVYDIDEKKKTVDIICDYPERLELDYNDTGLNRLDLVESIMRAYGDNLMFMTTYKIKSHNNKSEMYINMRPLSHSERFYNYFIYSLATNKKLIYDIHMPISFKIPEKEVVKLNNLHVGIKRQNNLYEEILKELKLEVGELASNLPESFFKDLKTAKEGYNEKFKIKTLTTLQKEDPPNLSLKDRLYNDY